MNLYVDRIKRYFNDFQSLLVLLNMNEMREYPKLNMSSLFHLSISIIFIPFVPLSGIT